MSDDIRLPINEPIDEKDVVPTLEEQVADASDAETIKLTQRYRAKMADAFMPMGLIPQDPKEARLLLDTINSMSDTAQKNIKNNIAADGNANVQEAIDMMMRIHSHHNGNDPFLVPVNGEIPDAPKVEEQLVEPDFVPGELATETKELTYDAFVDEFEAKRGS